MGAMAMLAGLSACSSTPKDAETVNVIAVEDSAAVVAAEEPDSIPQAEETAPEQDSL